MRTFFRHFILFPLLLLWTVVVGAQSLPDPLVWEWRNPLPTGNRVWGLQFLRGEFVAIDYPSRLLRSSDGRNWATHLVPGEHILTQIAYGDNLYVVVGFRPSGSSVAPVILTTTNLIDWTPQSPGVTNSLSAVTYGNGIFVAVGAAGALLTSADGIQWVARDSGTTAALRAVTYGNGVYVAIGSPREVSVSTDGISWTRSEINISVNDPYQSATGLTFGTASFARGVFHAGGSYWGHPGYEYGAVAVSTNGVDWNAATGVRNLFGTPSFFADDSRYFAVTSGLAVADDGVNFTISQLQSDVGWVNAAAYGHQTFVVFSSYKGLSVSTDGTNWIGLGETFFLRDIAHGNGVCVAVGDGGILLSSKDLPFSVQFSLPEHLYRVLFANELFHAVGLKGKILRSTNGVQWAMRTSGTAYNLRSLAHGNGIWVAVGENGTITTSPNGQAWTLRLSGTTAHLQSVTYGGGLFVAVGSQGTALTSPDGIQWTGQFTDTSAGLLDVVHALGQFVAVGYTNLALSGILLSSPDGIQWTSRDYGRAFNLQSVTAGNEAFFVLGGPDSGVANVLLSSRNGVEWTRHDIDGSSNPNLQFRTRFSSGSLFLIGGSLYGGLGAAILEQTAVSSIRLAGNWNSAREQFELIINRGLGQSFRVQSRHSLGTGPWIDRGIFTNAPSPVTFSDPISSPSEGSQFYRVVGD